MPAGFVHAIPDALPDAAAAPLLCAGAIGWRALRLTGIEDGHALGLTGFGASAHLVLQMVRLRFPASRVHINAIRKSDADKHELLSLDYVSDLWKERAVQSVANVTRSDVRETLAFAAAAGLRSTVEELPLADANDALARIANGVGVRGAFVLRVTTDAETASTGTASMELP